MICHTVISLYLADEHHQRVRERARERERREPAGVARGVGDAERAQREQQARLGRGRTHGPVVLFRFGFCEVVRSFFPLLFGVPHDRKLSVN